MQLTLYNAHGHCVTSLECHCIQLNVMYNMEAVLYITTF